LPTPLIVFDIDGTLTQSIPVDDVCYLQAIAEVFGIQGIVPDWSSYAHSTDQGIATEIVRRNLDRDLRPGEMADFRHRFVTLIESRLTTDPAASPPVPGARDLVASLDRPDHGPPPPVAVATGGFRDSARAKLTAAGLAAVTRWPFASGDDAVARAEIIELARARAGTPRPTVYVGDGVWDCQSAHTLGLGFVGIATGPRAAALRAAGARHVLPDFTDPVAFWDAVASAHYRQRVDATNDES
jgi:phosphoglycolate phosphatase-like HAD superfamily hydrolase